MRVILFGTGNTAQNYIKRLRTGVTVVAVTDNRLRTSDYTFCGFPWICPADIPQYDFEYVVILSIYIREIYSQLTEM